MKIESVDIYRYNLPLNCFLSQGNETLIEREGLIVRLASNGEEGFGEIAPLPGRSKETLERALAQIQDIKSELLTLTVPDKLTRLDGRLGSLLKKFELRPSVQFGLEMALLNLLANAKKTTLYHLLSTAFRDHIKINGLVHGDKESAVKQTKELLKMELKHLY